MKTQISKPFSFIDNQGRESQFSTAVEMATFLSRIRPQYRKDMEDGIDYNTWEGGKYSSIEEFRKLYSWSDSILYKNVGKK